MAITLDRTLTTEGAEAVLAALRSISDKDLEALRSPGLAARIAEQVLGERSHRAALHDELQKARSDVAQFEQHVKWREGELKKPPGPVGSARVAMEDELAQYKTRLSGALGNVAACEAEISRG